MSPEIIKKEALCIAGASGSGDETGKVWQAFRQLERTSPLRNIAGEEGYEVRIASGDNSAGRVHAGTCVRDTCVPAGYDLLFLPGSLYAEFAIHPARGWESSNAEIEKWLKDNASLYSQALLHGQPYAIEVYDQRYRGDKDPDSVVGMLIPVTRVVQP